MKNFTRLTQALMVILFAITFTRCSTKEPTRCEKPKNQLDTVSVEVANIAINRYYNVAKKSLGKVPIVSYTIPGIDLLQAMGYPLPKEASAARDTLAVRVYLGLRADSTFSLFVTAVRGASFCNNIPGKDVPLYPRRKGVEEISGSGYVLDFTMPCPATCGNSLFYTN